MATSTSKLTLLIDARNQASSELNRLQSALTNISNSVGLLSKGGGLLALGQTLLSFGRIAYDLGRSATEIQYLTDVFNEFGLTIGKTGDELSAAEQKMALVRQRAREAAGTATVQRTAFQELDLATQELTLALGNLFSDEAAASASRLAQAVNWLADAINSIELPAGGRPIDQWILGDAAGTEQAAEQVRDYALEAAKARGVTRRLNEATTNLANTYPGTSSNLFGFNQRMEEHEEATLEAERAQRQFARTLERDASAASARAESAFRSLQGRIESVLRSQLDPGVGVDPSDFLPREDAINEDARRLADIAVKGWSSPWVDYFRTEHPALWAEFFSGTMDGGDIQLQAAQMLRDFQDGLRPELLDRERAKALVRRMITGDQRMSELAQSLAHELSQEMGVSLPQALAGARGALGLSDTTETGAAAGGAFGTGLTDSTADAGNKVVSTFLKKIEERFQELYNAGSNAGSQWGNGFLASVGENIPPALIDLLVNLITPGVAANLRTQQTLTGAG